MPAESAPPVGRGSAVAQKDNTSLVMLTEGQLLCSCLLEVLMRSEMAKRLAVFLKGLGCPHPGEPALSLEEWNEPFVTILKIPTIALY